MNNFIDKPAIFFVKLKKWYHKNARKLPWRETDDPYKIWLSEIILQQTRVNQGIAYYYKFIDHYPTIEALASAEEEKILKDWQGLGYYSRARNLHQAAQFIHHHLKGQFPDDFEIIKSLKGIGDYTAAAIASFAFNLPHAVVDGNVYRLLSRIFGIKTPINSSLGKKEFTQLAQHLINKNDPAAHNQAIMEFGALQCTPKKPNCSQCIFNESCVAYKMGEVEKLPVKDKKVKQRKRFFHYFIIENNDQLLIHKREGKGIWQSLYDFPLLETSRLTSSKKLLRSSEMKEIFDHQDFSIHGVSKVRKHILSHQIIVARFYHVKTQKFPQNEGSDYMKIDKPSLKNYPIPKLIENYLLEETNLLYLSN